MNEVLSLTLNHVDLDLWRLDEEVGAGVAGVDAAVLRPRALQDQRADGLGRLVGQHAHPAASRGVVDWLKLRYNVKYFRICSNILFFCHLFRLFA